jgi:hypothetical protein
VIEMLKGVSPDRALLIVFLAGQLYSQFKGMRASQRLQGERIGKLEDRVAKLEGSRPLRP